jgi:hypothetical protein
MTDNPRYVKAEPQPELVERVAELDLDMDVALSSEAPYYQGQDPAWQEVDEGTRNEYRQRARERIRDAR